MKALLLALTLLTGYAQAADPFTKGQVAGIAALGLVTYQDYKQTLDIKNHPGMYEVNPLLGRHPSDERVRNYFVGASLTTLAVLYVMPSKYRKYVIVGGLAMELSVTQGNKRLGLRGAF